MLQRVLVIALNTYREAVRARVLHGLFGLAVATGGYALVVGAYALQEGQAALARGARKAHLDRLDDTRRAVRDDEQRVGEPAHLHVLEECPEVATRTQHASFERGTAAPESSRVPNDAALEAVDSLH